MTLHPYVIACAGREIPILAANDWHAIDHAMLIFGHIGAITAKRKNETSAL